MIRLLARAAAVVAALGLASCGGGNGTGPPSDLSPAAKAKWDGYCASRIACLADSNCPPSTCMAGIAEEGPLIEFVDCQNAKACGANDDDCVASAGTTDAERQAFITRCEAAVMSYQMMPQTVPDQCYPETALCSIVAAPLLRKQFMHAVDACLTLSCAQLQPCLDAALAPLDCW
jgi:hypothetical protein